MQENVLPHTATVEAEAADDLYARSNLTRMQLLYWTGQQLRPDTPLYAAPMAFTITGALDTHIFCQAMQAAMEQSDALRTVIHTVDGVPQQQELPSAAAQIQLQDFCQEDNPSSAAYSWLQQIVATPFDLKKPLIRFALAQFEPEKHIFLICQRHK